jgi:hypothetical protein
VPAALQAVGQLPPVAASQADLESFPEVRRGICCAACPQVQLGHLRQQAHLVPQVARVPAPGQHRPADALGGGQVPGLLQACGQEVAAHPGSPAGNVGRDLLGLPGQPQGIVEVAGVISGDAEVHQGKRLPRRVAELPGHGQGTAALLDGLGDPAQVRQCH